MQVCSAPTIISIVIQLLRTDLVLTHTRACNPQLGTLGDVFQEPRYKLCGVLETSNPPLDHSVVGELTFFVLTPGGGITIIAVKLYSREALFLPDISVK